MLAVIASVAMLLGGASAARAASYSSISAGLDHTCGLGSDGVVWCWGNGASGQLGVIGETLARVPVMVIGSYQTTQISSGSGYWCERLADATAACTGAGSAGQLGNGNSLGFNYPQAVVGLSHVTKISAGRSTTCAIDSGNLYCWGDDGGAQLGDGKTTSRVNPNPQQVAGLSNITDVNVGETSVCAVRGDGVVLCWGDNSDGKLGGGLTAPYTFPAPVKGLTGVRSVQVGIRHACALRTDGSVWCWGDNSAGELGDGSANNRATAAPVPGLGGVAQISVGGLSTCAVRSDATVWCWGGGLLGQLGNGAKANSSVPTQIKGITDAKQVTVGVSHMCVVSTSQVPACTGSNEFGQLGSGGRIGAGMLSTTLLPVIDTLRTATFVPTARAGLPTKTTAGGAVILRNFSLSRRGRTCPRRVTVTVTAKGHSHTVRAKPNHINGRCFLIGKFVLAPSTLNATVATLAVRSPDLHTVHVKLYAAT